MATYPYTGVLTDFAEAPFLDAFPRLWVQAENDAISGDHILASKRVYVTVNAGGLFTVNLVPSSETVPTTKYRLHCEWLNSDGTPLGFSEWQFIAQVGGGDIEPGAYPVATVWVGPPWPPGEPQGIYLDRYTNDVGVKL